MLAQILRDIFRIYLIFVQLALFSFEIYSSDYRKVKDFLMVIMASGIARGRIRKTTTAATKTTVELPNMAAIVGFHMTSLKLLILLLFYFNDV